MADTKISALTAVTVPASSDEFAVNQAAASKKVTLALVEEFLKDKGADVASAGTVALGDGLIFHITGTTTITDIDFSRSWDGRCAMLIFDGSLTLTHNATTLILPGKTNIQTAPGDSCWIVVDSGDNVKVISYERADGMEEINPSNASTAAQSPAAAATTYLTNSNLAVPPSGLKLKTVFRWRMSVAKTAAGVATKSILVKLGTAGTTADATILTFALPAGTAVVDEGDIEIYVTIRGPLGASCIMQGTLVMNHRLAEVTASELTGLINTRHKIVFVTSGTFTSSTAGLICGLAFVAGTAEAWTFSQLQANSWNL